MDPFLHTLANSNSDVLVERVRESVFDPLLESNVTQDSSDSEESEPEDLRQVDGGKLSKHSLKAVNAVINAKYVFENMNILMYAENYIFKRASAPADEGLIVESNRERLYELYQFALKLEPEKKPELTFSERMTLNRCRSFITMKMRKRMQMRQIKDGKKELKKKRRVLSDKLMEELKQRIIAEQQAAAEVEVASPEKAPVVVESGDTGKSCDEPVFEVKKAEKAPSDSTGSDDVLLTISKEQRKLKKRRRNKQPKSEA